MLSPRLHNDDVIDNGIALAAAAAFARRHWGDIAVGEVQPDPFRNIILFLLLGLAAAAWVALVWPAHNMTMHMTMASPTMGMRAAPFLAFWVVMMVAMMLPTAAPMILAFHSAQSGKRRPGVAFDSTWAF